MEYNEVLDDKGVCFFTSGYLFNVLENRKLPKNFVPSSTVIPHRVAPRAGLESGYVTNLTEYVFVYRRNRKRINTLEELIEYLNKHYP